MKAPGKNAGRIAATFCAMAAMLLPSVGFGAGPPADFRDLKVGQTVAVEGQPAGARTLQANKVKIRRAPKTDDLKGDLQVVNSRDNSLTIAGVKVIAARDASVRDADGKLIPLSSLPKGEKVKARGKLREDGALEAAEITVRKRGTPSEVEVEGKVQRIDNARSTLTVMGLTIRVVSTTRIEIDSGPRAGGGR